MTERVFVDGKPLDLRPEDFVAAGGQGRVFARGPLALKLFDDPADVPEPQKLADLRALAGPHVTAPERPVTDAQGRTIGYTMPFFGGAHSWAQLCTPAFRRRVGLDDTAALGLVRSLGAALTEIHRHGTTVVDLSENNVLVRGTEVCLIDLDSWQTPRHRATAITPSIVSPHVPAGQFGADTDWFSFAVLVTTLLLGIHPFKGKHPTVKGLPARMKAGLSVFDPQVRRPAVCKDPASLPTALRGWLRNVLERGASGPPPLGPLPSPTPQPVLPRHGHAYPETIRWVLVDPGRVVVATRTAAYADASCWHDDGRVLRALGRTHEGRAFIVQDAAHQGLELRVEGTEARVPLSLVPDDVMGRDGAVFVRTRGRILSLDVRILGARAVLLTREVARMLPHATQLFPGVALQNILGTWRASLLGHPRGTPQVTLGSWGSAEVLDARRDGDRLVALVQRGGVISRHRYTLGDRGEVVEHAVDSNVDPWGTTFVRVRGLYVEVGQKGLRQGAGDPTAPWEPLPGDLATLDLHTDGQRLFASSGAALHEVEGPAPTTFRLGFDVTRCR